MKIVAAAVVFFVSATLAARAQTMTHAQGQSRPVAVIHHTVSSNPKAQAAFDRGLLDYYAYNPEAAEHEFYTAADLDKHLAMAYWGIALSNAPNLNVPPTDDRTNQARVAIARAKVLETYALAEDRAFIDAAAARFDDQSKASADALLTNYRDALQRISLAYPEDPDAAALYAESALYVAVGKFSNAETPAQRAARVARVAALLPYFQASLVKFPEHIGLLHFYIHAAQIAGTSQVAVVAARQLAAFGLPPEDSHLTHMPGHTFFDVGLYEEALDVGQRSVAMDLADFACCHPGYYSAPRYYHAHNVSFLLYAMTQTGHLSEAVVVARREDNPVFIAKQLVADRDWQDVLALSDAKGNAYTLPFTVGLAYAKLGNAAQAQRWLAKIADADADDPSWAATVSAMRLTLSAQIALLENDDAKALQLLTDASVAADKGDQGAEMPALYYYSPHMALAELAVRLGKTDVAKAALQAELVASPRSPAALHALAQLGAGSAPR
jgi:tetratricopeptide (TPR) repeat protein